MASIINATTTAGVSVAGDNSGSLQLATNNGTTAVTIDTSQRVAFVAGTVALPAITTTGDTNTGIFFPAADTIAFTEGGAEAMRINSSGQVGIGTTSPSNPLHIVNSSANVNLLNLVGTNTYTSTSLGGEGPLRLQNTNTTNGNMSTISNYDGNGNINAQINFVNTNHSGTADIAFTTRSGGSYPEAMRITSAGDLLVGKTTSSFGTQGFAVNSDASTLITKTQNDSGGAQLYLNRLNVDGATILFYKNSSNVGNISVTGSATSYNTSSDYRLKENIAPMTGALAKVAQLKPVTYTWKLDGKNSQGFIAHELQEVVPDCVTGEKDGIEDIGTIADAKGNVIKTNVKNPDVLNKGLTWTKTGSEPKYQGIDTSFLVATLTAAIQELNAKVEAQAVRIAELEGAR
jgi:hypothetical protein